jgi:hypothetical protein
MELAVKFDQFYTKKEIALLCIEQMKKLIPEDRRLQYLEPSSGQGAFSLNLENCISVDIDPKTESAVCADFLSLSKSSLNLLSEDKVVAIGNPPFGRISSLAVKFFNKASEFADVIAFIVPRTFKKQSIKRRLNLYFHLIYEIDLPKKSFIFQGEEHDVPCSFQIWEKRKEKRDNSFEYESPYFTFVSPENADFAMRRVGGKTGQIVLDHSSVSRSSHYFIKAKKMPIDRLTNILSILDYSKYINSTAGVRSLSKAEIFFEFSEFIRINGV